RKFLRNCAFFSHCLRQPSRASNLPRGQSLAISREADVARRRHLASLIAGAALLAALFAGGALYGATRTMPCETSELTASIGASGAARGPGLDRMTIVLVGDAGFNATDAAVDAEGWHKGKAVTPFTDMTSGIAKDIDGDLAFVNV